MFERFTDRARQAVVLAQEEARERGAGEIRTEHLLVALVRPPGDLAVAVLQAQSVTPADVVRAVDALDAHDVSDAQSLATLGIDLDEVRRQVEEAFGPGALDRTRAARERGGRRSWRHLPVERPMRKALELALREALRMDHRYIGGEHLLLGLLHDGTAARVLRDLGVDQQASRALVEQLVRRRRAG
jgi:ATP-dependent Clp protease ATP-binding subunit ClpA